LALFRFRGLLCDLKPWIAPSGASLKFNSPTRQKLRELIAAMGIPVRAASLRVAMPQSFGVREVIPLLPEFLARHPALNLSFSMSDQRHVEAHGAQALQQVARLWRAQSAKLDDISPTDLSSASPPV
jgi:hypothetical protein